MRYMHIVTLAATYIEGGMIADTLEIESFPTKTESAKDDLDHWRIYHAMTDREFVAFNRTIDAFLSLI